jgi:hypothetical protein
VPPQLADRPLFSCRERTFSLAAAVALTGGPDERPALTGAASSPASERELAAAATAFRRERGLLAADDMRGWLERWGLEAADFSAWLGDRLTGSDTASAWCALVCSGGIDAAIQTLAAGVAAAAELGAEIPADLDEATIRAFVERFLERPADPALIDGELAAHRLEWTRVEVTTVTADRPAVLEELRHLVGVDGVSFADAASRAGLQTANVVAGFDELDPALGTVLVGVEPPELCGPVSTSAGSVLAQVAARSAPDPADPRWRARAQEALARRALAAALARHVRWHDHA